jgi:hypothetical protein
VQLANGTYQGRFTLSTSGLADQRIQVCGGAGAVLDGGGWATGYGLWLKGSYVDLVGFSLVNSQKGVMLDGASYDVLDGLSVSQIGDEGIHLRTNSHNDLVRGVTVHDTGLRVAGYGEGVYVGSATNNWCKFTACLPDRSDHNAVVSSSFWANGAEAVDIKEGTTGTVLTGSIFDGTGSTALSWVDAKGNDALISGNSGKVARRDGFLTETAASGWGVHNTFELNTAHVLGPGYGFNVTSGNYVTCMNAVYDAAKGFSDIACA